MPFEAILKEVTQLNNIGTRLEDWLSNTRSSLRRSLGSR